MGQNGGAARTARRPYLEQSAQTGAIRENLERLLSSNSQCSLCVKLPELDGPTKTVTTVLWRWHTQHVLYGERLRQAYDAVSHWQDWWKLRQYCVAANETRRTKPKVSYAHTHTDTQGQGKMMIQIII